jgi:hypothetical protein
MKTTVKYLASLNFNDKYVRSFISSRTVEDLTFCVNQGSSMRSIYEAHSTAPCGLMEFPARAVPSSSPHTAETEVSSSTAHQKKQPPPTLRQPPPITTE